MLTQQRVINTLSNNIVNVNTPGARAERLVTTTFENELVKRLDSEGGEIVGMETPMRIAETVYTAYDQGFTNESGRPFDFAISGDGFFSIAFGTLEDGTQQIGYTRNGNFDIDDEGFLELRGVGRVLGEAGEIYLGTSDFTVLENGTILDAAGNVVDVLRMRMPADYEDMQHLENGLFLNTNVEAETNMVNGAPISVMQGFIESSNIDMNREYTLVMEAQRAFQSCSAALQIIDTINQRAVNELGSL